MSDNDLASTPFFVVGWWTSILCNFCMFLTILLVNRWYKIRNYGTKWNV